MLLYVFGEILDKHGLLKKLAEAVIKGDERAVERLCGDVIKAKVPIEEAVVNGLCRGMRTVGELFKKREYFLADLLISAEAMRVGLNHLLPHLKGEERAFLGKVVIGVVKGNIHDLGKNIVVAMLRADGFEVHDLGVDVQPRRFIEKVKETGAELIGMSVYTSNALPMVEEIERTLKEAGLRTKVKTMVGGAAASPSIAKKYGVDAYGKDAIEAVRISKSLLERLRKANKVGV